jgi:4-amino-4-deoxy-L-arabinose transferase-like glycosyltransferase
LRQLSSSLVSTVELPSGQASRGLLAVLVLLHVALAFWFGSNTPYRTPGKLLIQRGAAIPDVGAPDERQHANYVAHLVEGKGFPVFEPKSPDFGESYESHQPPLYYGLAAGYSKLIGLDADMIRSPGGRAVRWLNLVFSAAGIVGAFFLGSWGYGRKDIGLIAAAFAALLPMNLALSGSVSNDPLLIALFAWTIAVAARGVREGWTTKLALTCGILAGLALLTKSTGIALLLVLGVAAMLRRPTAKQAIAVIAPAILLPLPWLLRNQSLYGDPLALRMFQQAFVGSAQSSIFIDNPQVGLLGYLVNWLGWWTARSFFGAFGYMDIWLNETGNPYSGPNALYRILLALLLVAFVGWLLRVRESDGAERRVHLLGTLTFVIVTALFLRFGLQYFQAQARYLFPALAPIACGVAWGAVQLSKGNWKVAFAAVALPLLAVAILAGSILPAEFAKRM